MQQKHELEFDIYRTSKPETKGDETPPNGDQTAADTLFEGLFKQKQCLQFITIETKQEVSPETTESTKVVACIEKCSEIENCSEIAKLCPKVDMENHKTAEQ